MRTKGSAEAAATERKGVQEPLSSCCSSWLSPAAPRAGWRGLLRFVVSGCGLCNVGQKGKNGNPRTVCKCAATQKHLPEFGCRGSQEGR